MCVLRVRARIHGLAGVVGSRGTRRGTGGRVVAEEEGYVIDILPM